MIHTSVHSLTSLQFCPSSVKVYPSAHSQEKEPTVLRQRPLRHIPRSKRHSSTSEGNSKWKYVLLKIFFLRRRIYQRNRCWMWVWIQNNSDTCRILKCWCKFRYYKCLDFVDIRRYQRKNPDLESMCNRCDTRTGTILGSCCIPHYYRFQDDPDIHRYLKHI